MCLGQTVYGGEEAAWVPASHTMAEGPVPPSTLTSKLMASTYGLWAFGE